MPHHLVAKLSWFNPLSQADREALLDVATRDSRQVEARRDIVREGEGPGPVKLILRGWACRYRHLEDGRRQVTALLLPGDLCDVHAGVLRGMDHAIGTFTPVTVAEIAAGRLLDLAARHPPIGRALTWEAQVSQAIQRRWIVNIGHRSADERVGHLLCELFVRLRAVGLAREDGYDLPLRPIDLADALGIGTAHMSCSLRKLRARNLIMLDDGRLRVLDMAALQRAVSFDPAYLPAGRVGGDVRPPVAAPTNPSGYRPAASR